MKKALHLLNDYRLNELGKKMSITVPQSREELIESIWESSKSDVRKQVYMISALNNHYRSHYDIATNLSHYHYSREQLIYHHRFKIKRGKEGPWTIRFTRALKKDGSVGKNCWSSPRFTEEESALFQWRYGNDFGSGSCFFEPIMDRQDVSLFFSFLEDYYENKNRTYVYEGSQTVVGGYYMVNLHLKGWERYAFNVLIEKETKKLKSVTLLSGGKGKVPGLLDEKELVQFITEQSPLRMELLFQ